MSTTLQEQLEAELATWQDAGLRRHLALPDGVDFTSNNYLALATDPRLVEAAREALERDGVGAAAARLLRGHLEVHQRAEAAAANWLGTEAALLFVSGWQANQAVLTTFAGAGDVIFSDALNHASLIDGARLSKASVEIFAHNDLADLSRRLARHTGARRRLVVVESIYSMDGDLAPLDELVALAERYDAHLYIDHAHGAGVFEGRFVDSPRALGQMVTGGKALGVGGAFVCASEVAIDLLVNRGRAFVFTTAVPPATAAALRRAIELIQAEPARRERVHHLAALLRRRLQDGGVDAPGKSPIVPVLLGSADRAMAIAEQVRHSGYDVRAVRPPTVPAGTSRLRIVVHADHDEAQIEGLAKAVCAAVGEHADEVVAQAATPVRPAPLVVCGTDTGVGKTVVSAVLVRALLRADRPVRYLKPVQTGEDSDTVAVTELAGLPEAAVCAPVVELPLPASVDQAAEHAGMEVCVDQVERGVSAHLDAAPEATWVLECAGGLRVPYNEREDQADLLQRLNAPVVLVARSGLGTLNHTLLTLDGLSARKLEVVALFLVGPPHPANLETLRRRLGSLAIFELDHLDPLTPAAVDDWLAAHRLEDLLR